MAYQEIDEVEGGWCNHHPPQNCRIWICGRLEFLVRSQHQGTDLTEPSWREDHDWSIQHERRWGSCRVDRCSNWCRLWNLVKQQLHTFSWFSVANSHPTSFKTLLDITQSREEKIQSIHMATHMTANHWPLNCFVKAIDWFDSHPCSFPPRPNILILIFARRDLWNGFVHRLSIDHLRWSVPRLNWGTGRDYGKVWNVVL